MSMNNKVSVVVANYHPIWEKLIYTLDSLLMQDGVDLEIVIADDGSPDDLFDQIKDYFAEKSFVNYQLCPHEENQGTVINVRDGVAMATGDYVKLISPGDALAGERALVDWLDYMLSQGKQWSFCDAIYYMLDDDGKHQPVKQVAKPLLIQPYIKKQGDACRWNYLALDDLTIGAATLCERSLLLTYLNRIVGKVKYAEDNSYRMMMFDNILPAYYACDAVVYEYGGGASTSKNDVWKQRLLDDFYATNEEIMCGTDIKELDKLQSKVIKLYEKKKHKSSTGRLVLELMQKGKLKLAFVRHFCPRWTNV